MKKIILILGLTIAGFWPKSMDAQTAAMYKSQLDSTQMLFYEVLSRYDSVSQKNNELIKQVYELSSQVENMKKEIDSMLKKKNEAETEMTETKKTISELISTIDKLEAEVKRLSQTKKKQ
jgi:peptidoglycan hydrolase CwlO-like protein